MIVGGIIIFVLALILLLIIQSRDQQLEFIANQDLNNLEASYTTRMMLTQEISPGYKVYDLVVDTVNNKLYSAFDSSFSVMVDRTYGAGRGSWIIRIRSSGQDYVSFLGIEDNRRPEAAALNLPMIAIPNQDGGIIYVLFKQIKNIDYELENTKSAPPQTQEDKIMDDVINGPGMP